jgi:hypothetical protein
MASRRYDDAPKGKSPLTLGEVLGKSPDLRPKPGQVSLTAWRSAVGLRIAERSRPRRLVGGVLWVEVTSSTWAQELSLHAETILLRLRETGLTIDSLRFQIGAGSPALSKPRKEEPRLMARREPLPGELEARLRQVDDPALRDAIATAAAFALGRRRSSKRK